MKRIALILLGALCSLGLAAQTEETPSAVLGCFIADGSATNVRNAPNGQVVRQLPVAGIYTLAVCNPKDGWWQILNGVVEEIDGETIEIPGEAWIHSSVIGASLRNYGGEPMQLRSEPRRNASVTGRITVQEDLVRPLDITDDGDWVKVRWSKYTGWIEAEWLCGNPVSTCP